MPFPDFIFLFLPGKTHYPGIMRFISCHPRIFCQITIYLYTKMDYNNIWYGVFLVFILIHLTACATDQINRKECL